MRKEKKHFNLDEDVIEIIQRVKEEQGFNTEVKALMYIVREYNAQKEDTISDEAAEKLADIILAKYNEQYYKYMDRIRWAVQTAETNSIITKDAINTMLINQGIQHCILTDVTTSPVISTSLEWQKNKVEHFKQQKEDRKKRKK